MVTTNVSRRILPAVLALGFTAAFNGGPAFAQDVIKVGAPLPLTGVCVPKT